MKLYYIEKIYRGMFDDIAPSITSYFYKTREEAQTVLQNSPETLCQKCHSHDGGTHFVAEVDVSHFHEDEIWEMLHDPLTEEQKEYLEYQNSD